MLTELRCTVQFLEIYLDSKRNLKASLENSLKEVEASYTLQMEQLNRILQSLEAEIATYRYLLEDGKDFNPGEAATPCKPSKRPPLTG
ncbi:Keratin, type I cytoskeletal 18 [Plecturocebus cupreus]